MRIAEKNRDTKETKIYEKINLDGNGMSEIDTGIGFFDHMLTLFAFHSNFDLTVKADGDLEGEIDMITYSKVPEVTGKKDKMFGRIFR